MVWRVSAAASTDLRYAHEHRQSARVRTAASVSTRRFSRAVRWDPRRRRDFGVKVVVGHVVTRDIVGRFVIIVGRRAELLAQLKTLDAPAAV